MNDMPNSQPAGTVYEFMFKEGVQDQFDKVDNDLVGLIPVKQRVKEIATLLVLDKMRRKLGFELKSMKQITKACIFSPLRPL
jgi:hypothetical protein